MAAGLDHTWAVRTDGTLWCWGLNTSGQLGDGSPDSHSLPTQVRTETTWATVDTGDLAYTCATRTDGTLWCWGDNTSGLLSASAETAPVTVPCRVGSATNWADVSMGRHSASTVTTDGVGYGWGYNDRAQASPDLRFVDVPA